MMLAIINDSGFFTLTLIGLAFVAGFLAGWFTSTVQQDIASKRDAKITAAFLKALGKFGDSEVEE